MKLQNESFCLPFSWLIFWYVISSFLVSSVKWQFAQPALHSSVLRFETIQSAITSIWSSNMSPIMQNKWTVFLISITYVMVHALITLWFYLWCYLSTSTSKLPFLGLLQKFSRVRIWSVWFHQVSPLQIHISFWSLPVFSIELLPFRALWWMHSLHIALLWLVHNSDDITFYIN